jgi:hypothetical protein
MIKISVTIALLIFVLTNSFSQDFPEKEILKRYHARKIIMDEGNGDGVFKIQNKKSKKWGMYQWMYEGTECDILVPMMYDSLNYFPFNGRFTAVYNNGKVGFYLSKWSYGEDAKRSVPTKYDGYQRFTFNNKPYLAVIKNGKWGWIDWLTGEEMSEFIYETKDDLPSPNWDQQYFFE